MKRRLLLMLMGVSNTFSTPFFLISIPKCGTHLLARCLELLTQRKISYTSALPSYEEFNNSFTTNHFLCSHLPYDPEYEGFFVENNIKVFFIIRDPRDQVVSFAHWIYKYFNHVMTFNELITYLIREGSGIYETFSPFKENPHGLAEYYQRFLSWQHASNVCTVRFEDLIGVQGGGSSKKQRREIKKIAAHLGLILSKEQLDSVQNDIFGGTLTFKEGAIGAWRRYFSPEHCYYFSTHKDLIHLLNILHYRLPYFDAPSSLSFYTYHVLPFLFGHASQGARAILVQDLV